MINNMQKWFQKLTDEMLFARRFNIKTHLPAEECAERIERLSQKTRHSRSGYATYIHSLGGNEYRVLMHTRRTPGKTRTAELRGYIQIRANGETRVQGKAYFGRNHYLGALAGLLFAIFVSMMVYDINVNTWNMLAIDYVVAIRDTLLVGAVLGAIPVYLLIRIYRDRNHLLRTLANALQS